MSSDDEESTVQVFVNTSLKQSDLIVSQEDHGMLGKQIKKFQENPGEWTRTQTNMKTLQSIYANQDPKHSFEECVELLARGMIEFNESTKLTAFHPKNLKIRTKRIFVQQEGSSLNISLKPDNPTHYEAIVGVSSSMITNDSVEDVVISVDTKNSLENKLIKQKICGNIELQGNQWDQYKGNDLVVGVIPAGAFIPEPVVIFENCEDTQQRMMQTINSYIDGHVLVDLKRFTADAEILDKKDDKMVLKNVFVGIKAHTQLFRLISRLEHIIEKQIGYRLIITGQDNNTYPLAIPIWLLSCIYYASQAYYRAATFSFDVERPLTLNLQPVLSKPGKPGKFGMWVVVHSITYPKN